MPRRSRESRRGGRPGAALRSSVLCSCLRCLRHDTAPSQLERDVKRVFQKRTDSGVHCPCVETRRWALHTDDRGELTAASPYRCCDRVEVVLALADVVREAAVANSFELRRERGSALHFPARVVPLRGGG